MNADSWAKMGPGVEFDLIRRMAARWGDLVQACGRRRRGPGCARMGRDSSRPRIRPSKAFTSGANGLSLQEIGYRATAASLSDLAAMAAEPIGLLIAATIPAGVAETIESLADGIGQAARDAGCPIVGGDLTGGDRISLTMTVLGSAAPPVDAVGCEGRGLALGHRPAWAVRVRGSRAARRASCLRRNICPALRTRSRAWPKRAGWPSAVRRR